MTNTIVDTDNAWSERLRPFSDRNPEVELRRRDDVTFVYKPWADDTLIIRVGVDADELVHELNRVRLTPRFSAVWHTETNDLEIIYAPLPPEDDTASRTFIFFYQGTEYSCSFGPASRAVETIASNVRPLPPHSDTNHRNLVGLRSFMRFKASNPDAPGANHVLTSFWVRSIELSEGDLVEFARHLNFYMRYFDRETPVVLVHPEPSADRDRPTRVRYPHGAFPATILGRQLDPYLLGLWESASFAYDPFREFVYNYQVLEYAAFYYIREEVYQAVRRIATSPDLLVRLDDAARQILEVVVEDRTSDDAKIVAVTQKAVDPAILWREIEPHAGFFSQPTEFEGGFCLPPLLKAGWGFDDFRSAWIPKLPDALRKLRNALVHARETRQSCCIAPSRRNEAVLRRWAKLMSALAGQVIIFGEHGGV